MHDGMRRQLGRLAVAIGLLVALAGCVVAPYGPGYHGYYHGYGDHGGYGGPGMKTIVPARAGFKVALSLTGCRPLA